MNELYLDRESDEAYDILMSCEYINHISAMTKEALHSKADIAIELARRDIKIKQLQQYKSLVKTVDADNLPDGEVLAFNIDENFLFGHLCSGKSVCENKYFFWCETSDDAIYEVTHYIEQKDLIKLITGNK